MCCSAILLQAEAQHPELVAQLRKQLEGWQQTLPSQPTGDVFSTTRKK